MGHCSCNAHGIVVVNIQGEKHKYLFYYNLVLVYLQHYQSKVEHKYRPEICQKKLYRQDFSGGNYT
jgi:hypothetical protein